MWCWKVPNEQDNRLAYNATRKIEGDEVKQDQNNTEQASPSLLGVRGSKEGIAAWDTDHGQPDKPDLFVCQEDYFHFPCGMCLQRFNRPESVCVGCRHYCP